MNNLRKFGNWLWLNKERMVLVVMVSFLVFRVYQVVYGGGEEKEAKNLRSPAKELPSDVPTPGMPPTTPPPPKLDDWSRLWRLSPLQWRAPRSSGAAGQNSESEELNLKLLRIREMSPGNYRAQINTGSRTGWYEEGQAFEIYELLEIDPDTQTVTIFSEKLQRSFELPVEP